MNIQIKNELLIVFFSDGLELMLTGMGLNRFYNTGLDWSMKFGFNLKKTLKEPTPIFLSS